MDYIILYAEDYNCDVWLEYCDICGVGYDTTSIKIKFNPKDVEAYCDEDEDEEEDEVTGIRYYVCGLGYDQNDNVTGCNMSFGDFDTYEEAYELFVKLQCKDVNWFFEGAPKVYQLLIQLEECEEYDDYYECVDVKNEWWIVNPNFNKENE